MFTASPAWLSSCSEEKEETPAPEIPITEAFNTTYTNRPFPENELVLTYCGAPLTGRDAVFFTRDMKTAAVTVENALPGRPSTSFTVNMTVDSKNKELYHLKVAGGRFVTEDGIEVTMGPMSVERGRLKVNFTGVKMLPDRFSYNSLYTGWWGLAPEALYMYWEVVPGTYPLPSGGSVTVKEGENINPGIVGMLPELINSMLMPSVLRNIHFGTEGRIRAYYSPFSLESEPEWTLSPAVNLCHYYMRGDRLMLRLNIEDIIAYVDSEKTRTANGDGNNGPSIDESAIVRLLSMLSGWVTAGIPLDIRNNGDGSTMLYLAPDEIAPLIDILPDILLLLKDPLLEKLEELLEGDDGILDGLLELLPEGLEGLGGSIVPIVGTLLESVAAMLSATETFELGLNIIPAEAPAEEGAEE